MDASTTTGGPSPSGKAPATKTKLSRDEHAALLQHHMGLIAAAAAGVKEAKGPYQEAQDLLTSKINEAKADLGKGYTRKYLLGLQEDRASRLRDLLKEEERRYRDRIALSLPVFGEQQELTFGGAETPQEAKDELYWEAEGYLRGRRGDIKLEQEGDPPRFRQAILLGAEKGQKETQAQFLVAQELIAKRGQPDADAAPRDLNGATEPTSEPEPGTPEANAAERQSIARAKESLGVNKPANRRAA